MADKQGALLALLRSAQGMLLPQVDPEAGALPDEESPSCKQPEQSGLQEPEDNEIRTVHAGDTPYTSATSFEDLPLSEPLLQVGSLGSGCNPCQPALCGVQSQARGSSLTTAWPRQGLYTEMKFEKPSRIQATTLPMILTPPYRSLIAQVRTWAGCMMSTVAALRQSQTCLCGTGRRTTAAGRRPVSCWRC